MIKKKWIGLAKQTCGNCRDPLKLDMTLGLAVVQDCESIPVTIGVFSRAASERAHEPRKRFDVWSGVRLPETGEEGYLVDKRHAGMDTGEIDADELTDKRRAEMKVDLGTGRCTFARTQGTSR
jgi:hypothetical protein